MGLFNKKKNLDRSDSWSLGKGNLNRNKDSTSSMAFEKPAQARSYAPPTHIVEMGTNDEQLQPPPESQTQPQPDVQTNRAELPSIYVSSKSFAVELDSSTISSLPPSHRDGGSISGSEPHRGPSTRATSHTSSPTEQNSKPDATIPEYDEKEVVVSKGPVPKPPSVVNSEFSTATTEKESFVPSRPESSRFDSNKRPESSRYSSSTRPESSIFSLPVTTPSATSRVYREYNFYNTPNFKDLVICDPSQKAMFYAEVSSHTRSKSDVALREFSEDLSISGSKSMSIDAADVQKSRIVAVSDFVPDENAKQISLGIGDPLDPAGCTWVVMKNVTTDPAGVVERFDMSVPTPDGDLVFQWIKGGANDPELGDDGSSAKEAYRLVCENSTVASFRNTSMKNVRKRGSLRVYEGPMVDQYLLLIFLSGASMSEMYRRRRCKKVRRSLLVPF